MPETFADGSSVRATEIAARATKLRGRIDETRSRLKARLKVLDDLAVNLDLVATTPPRKNWHPVTREAMLDLHDAILDEVEAKTTDLSGAIE